MSTETDPSTSGTDSDRSDPSQLDPDRTKPGQSDPNRTDSNRPELECVTIENGDEPDECAIFPKDGTEAELLGEWISALEGSYVDLESSR